MKSGLDRLGSDLVNDVSDLELRRAQELRVGLGGQKLSDSPVVVFGGPMNRLKDAFGFGSLFRSEVEL